MVHRIDVDHNPDSQKFVVSYEGENYEVNYSVSAGCVELEVYWGGDYHQKMTAQIGGGSPLGVARMMALEILRGAKERGELI